MMNTLTGTLPADVTCSFPFEDPWVVLQASGRAIWDALEAGVCLYPAAEGRFPQVSGMNFTFDPSRLPGSRVLSVRVGDSPLSMSKTYRLCTRDYMARGKDGFTALLSTSSGGSLEELVSAQEGLRTYEVLLKYFESLEDCSGSDSDVDSRSNSEEKRGTQYPNAAVIEIADETLPQPDAYPLFPSELSSSPSTSDAWSSNTSETDISTGESSRSSSRAEDCSPYTQPSIWDLEVKGNPRLQQLAPTCEGRIRISQRTPWCQANNYSPSEQA